MAKKDKVAEALELLAKLKTSESSGAIAGLSKLIESAPCYVVSRTADHAAECGYRALNEIAAKRLLQVCNSAKSDDIGVAAALSLVKMLITLEAGYEAEEAALAATKLYRYEPVWGGSADVAASVRGNAAILLAAMGSREALRAASELLAESDQPPPRERMSWPARADAAKALGMIGTEGASAILRFKLIIGDSEPTVLSECLSGLLSIDREKALPQAIKMLESLEHQEAALLALGGWRDPRAIELLLKYDKIFLESDSRDLYLASIAMTRQPLAIEYLIQLIQSKEKRVKDAALRAIEPLRVMSAVAERLRTLKY